MPGEMMREEMWQQPEVLAGIAGRAGSIGAAVLEVAPRPLRAVMLAGRGSSDNAAVLGRYAIEFASGVPTGLVAPSLHTRYAADVDYRGVLVVGLSQSGETPEIVATCEQLQVAGAVVVGVTNASGSPLAAISDRCVALDAGEERAVPATKTVTAQMAVVLAIASALTPVRRGADDPLGLRDLDRLADAVAEVLADDRPAARLGHEWSGYDRMVVSGRGLGYAAALETALKVAETARIRADGISSFDLLHGPIAAVGSSVPVLVLKDDDPTARDADDLAARLVATSCPVATCSTGEESDLPLPCGLPAALQPVVATVRGQQLAYHLAIERGFDPDVPVGLSKMTATR